MYFGHAVAEFGGERIFRRDNFLSMNVDKAVEPIVGFFSPPDTHPGECIHLGVFVDRIVLDRRSDFTVER